MKNIPTKEELTHAQLGPLLAIVREFQPYLVDSYRDAGDAPKSGPTDGGILMAAEQTFINVCARIDKLVGDDSRFENKSYSDLAASTVKLQAAQLKFVALQTASAARLQSPSFLLRPTLAVLDNKYVAVWGELGEGSNAIVGIGATPNEALADFDKAFDRAPKEQVQIIAEKTGLDLTQPKTPPTE
jgi:hypothetical protein